MEALWSTEVDQPAAVKSPEPSMSGMFGKMWNSPVKLATQATSMVVNPVTGLAKATIGAPMGMAGHLAGSMTEQVIGRGQVRCVLQFGNRTYSTEAIGEQGPGEGVAQWYNQAVTWHINPGERQNLEVKVLRKKHFGMNMQLKGKEEEVGTFTVQWEDLANAAEIAQPIDQWFPVTATSLEGDETREVYMHVELITTPIDGAEQALFDPLEDMLGAYLDFFNACCGPETSMIRTPAVNWLLGQMRARCGVGEFFDHVLRLSNGLILETQRDLAPLASIAIREGRMVQLVDSLKLGPDLPMGTIVEHQCAINSLEMIRSQVRNELLNFPYRLACKDGGEEEPNELRLLISIDELTTKELERLSSEDRKDRGEDDEFADADGEDAYRRPTPPTAEVVRQGLARFAGVFYGEQVAASLAKVGKPIQGGELGSKQLKRVTKHCHIVVTELSTQFGPVLPEGTIGACLVKLVDMLTVDIAGIIASYHIRVQTNPDQAIEQAFNEGSDEQMLLKLHHRVNLLQREIHEVDKNISLSGLSTSTAPVLKAWVDNTRRTILRWMAVATKNEQWERASEDAYHSAAVIDVFASAHQAVETFVQLQMGLLTGVRTAFLECLGELCTRFIHIMREAGQNELREKAEAAQKQAEKTGSYAGLMATMGGNVVTDILHISTLGAFKSSHSHSTRDLSSHPEGHSKEADGHGEGGWASRGEVYAEKLEHLADDLTSVSAWGKGLKSLGSKSLKASMTLTKKTVNVASLGTVHLGSKGEAEARAAQKEIPKKIFTPKDFYDGSRLVSVKGCCRMSNAVKVKEQMDAMVTRIEQGEREAGVEFTMNSVDWTLTPQMTAIYDRIKTQIQGTFELELGPLLQQISNGIRAALTDEGGTPPPPGPERNAMVGAVYTRGMKVKRGPDWKWGDQDGGLTDDGTPPAGVITEVKGNGWCKVRWPAGNEESYRVGENGMMCDIMPDNMTLPDPDLAPALQAIVDVLDVNLEGMRHALDDRNFATCLRITWLSSIEVLETCVNEDVRGTVDFLRRASAILGQLRSYMHADGAGVPMDLIDRSSNHLQRILDASLS